MALPLPRDDDPQDATADHIPQSVTMVHLSWRERVVGLCRLCGHPHADTFAPWVRFNPQEDAPGGQLPTLLTLARIADHMAHLALVCEAARGLPGGLDDGGYLKANADLLMCWALERLAANPMCLYTDHEGSRATIGALACDYRLIANVCAPEGARACAPVHTHTLKEG